MSFAIYFVMLFLVVLPLGVFLRFIDLGIRPNWALKMLFKFPKEIIQIHYILYKLAKKKDRKTAVRILFAPITNFPDVIISYSEMYINAYAKLMAVKELLKELDDKEVRKLAKILKQQGIIIKKHKVKKMDVIDDSSNVDTYADNVGLGHFLVSP